NGAGEFEFTMAAESLDIDSLDYRPNNVLSFLQHQTFIRVFDDGRYWFTGQPLHIERSEESSGELIVNVKCYGAMHWFSRFNSGKRSYQNTRATTILRDLLSIQSLILPGEIEFHDEISISFSRENLLDAIHALRETLGGDMFVDPHTMTFHWVRRQGGIGPEIRYQKNMTFIRLL